MLPFTNSLNANNYYCLDNESQISKIYDLFSTYHFNNLNQLAACDAGPDQDVCGFTTTLAGTDPDPDAGMWTKVSGSGMVTFGNVNQYNTSITVDAYDTYVFKWTITGGTCNGDYNVTINFYQQPIANAGSGGDECDYNFNLDATLSTPGSGIWTKASGSGNESFSPNANDPDAVVTVDAYDNYVFRWTETNGTCSDFADVTVNFYQQPVANAGSGGDECDYNFNLDATLSTPGSGTWTKASGSGNESFSPNANDPDAVVTVDAYDNYVFRWTETNGTCSDFADVTVNFYQQPVADAGADHSVCVLNCSLNANASIGMGTWTYTGPMGETANFFPNDNDANVSVTVTGYGTYTFTWTELNGTCSDSDDAVISFNEPPAPPTCPADLSVCLDATEFAITGENPTGGIYSGTGITTSPNFDPAAAGLGNHTITYTITDGNGCTNSCTFNITVYAPQFYSTTTMSYYCTFSEAQSVTNDGDEIDIPSSGSPYSECMIVTKNITIKATGGPVTLNCLTMNGSGKNLTLGSNLTITAITMTAGKIHTNGFNLKAGNITGANGSKYIVTD
jgi:hypothetical protein